MEETKTRCAGMWERGEGGKEGGRKKNVEQLALRHAYLHMHGKYRNL